MDPTRHAVLLATLVALAGATARAEPAMGLALSANAGLAAARDVRPGGSQNVDTTPQYYLAATGSFSAGPLVAGVDLDAALGGYAEEVYAGGFLGEQLKTKRWLFQLVGEGGEHFLADLGADDSHTSTVDTVMLPYLGARLRAGRRLAFAGRKGSMFMGVSAFVRRDIRQEQITATLTERCALFDFECEQPPSTTETFEVGGWTGGLVFDFTWWSAGWFR